MNLLKFGFDLLKSNITNEPKPLQVTINITNKCNLKCKYCYATYYNREFQDIEVSKWIRLIKNLKKLGTAKINLAGGEPLLYRGIDKVIETIHNEKIDCYVNSNGLLVPSKIDILKNIKCLALSLDGRPEANDPLRGEGVHDKVIKALNSAFEAGIPIQIATVLGEHSLDEIPYLLNLAKKYKANLNIMTQIPERKDHNIEMLNFDEKYYDVVRKIQEYKKNGEPITYSASSWQNFLQWPKDLGKDLIMDNELNLIPDNCKIKCRAGKNFIVVDYNGDLYPCCSLVGITKHANVFEKDINKNNLKEALKIVSNHKCAACSFPHNAEMNKLFSMDIATILNLIKIY